MHKQALPHAAPHRTSLGAAGPFGENRRGELGETLMLKGPLLAAAALVAAAAAEAPLTPGEPRYADPLSAPPALLAGAGAADGGWRVSAVNRHVPKGDDVFIGYALYTDDTSQPGLIIRCNRGKLAAGVSLEGADFGRVLADASLISMTRATVEIGAAAPLHETWGFLKRHKVAFPRDAVTATRLYNAAAKGETIRISVGKYKNVAIALPPPSTSAFAAFVGDCGLGAPSR